MAASRRPHLALAVDSRMSKEEQQQHALSPQEYFQLLMQQQQQQQQYQAYMAAAAATAAQMNMGMLSVPGGMLIPSAAAAGAGFQSYVMMPTAGVTAAPMLLSPLATHPVMFSQPQQQIQQQQQQQQLLLLPSSVRLQTPSSAGFVAVDMVSGTASTLSTTSSSAEPAPPLPPPQLSATVVIGEA